MFEIGQKVVCVDDTFSEVQAAILDHLVREGQVYTVRAVRVSADADALIMDHRREVNYAVLLVGIVNGVNRGGGLVLKEEPGYRASRFRSLQWMKQQVAETREAVA